MKNFIHHIRKYTPLSNEEAEELPQYVRIVKLKKKEVLLKEGQICNANYFVSEGCLRMYFIKDNGVEETIQFAIEGWWLADYFSLTTKTPSSFYIQAIENSHIIQLDSSLEAGLFNKLPQMEHYYRLVIQRAYAASQQRIKFFYEYSREELYHHFILHYPEFIQRTPQYMLASYLGITPEYLSELRRKKP